MQVYSREQLPEPCNERVNILYAFTGQIVHGDRVSYHYFCNIFTGDIILQECLHLSGGYCSQGRGNDPLRICYCQSATFSAIVYRKYPAQCLPLSCSEAGANLPISADKKKRAGQPGSQFYFQDSFILL